MENKKSWYAAILTFVGCLLFLNFYFYIKYGSNYLNVEDLKWGIPLWTILLTYTSYGSVQYYYKQKNLYLPAGLEEELKEKREKEWWLYKTFLFSRLLKILSLMFGMAFPVYLLAYMDGSEVLHSNPFKIVCFLILTLVSGIGSVVLRKKYGKHISLDE